MNPDEKQKDTPTEKPEELSPDDLAMLAAYFENNQIGTRAWMATHPKASYASAGVSATEWLKKPRIKDEITRILNENLMSIEEAMSRTADIARADLFPFIRIDNDGFVWFNFKDPLARKYLFLIKKIKTKRERRIDSNQGEWEGEWVEVELYDAQEARRDILKMYGKLKNNVDVTSGGEKITPAEMKPSEIA